jgi:hypothetical protein
VESILNAVKQLSPDEFAEFTVCLAEWQGSAGNGETPDTFLVEQTRLRLPPSDAKRLRLLAKRSEAGRLGPTELDEYRRLAARAEGIAALRVRALAELARRRNQPVSQVKQEIGWKEERHGA